MIHVIATIELNEGRKDDFLTVFHKLVPLVLGEDGCLDYGPAVDLKTGISSQVPLRQNVVTVVERWESLEALQAHLSAPHMNQFREDVKGMIAKLSLQVLTPV